MIREVNEKDWKRVEEIYLQGIEKGIATFNTTCPSYEEWNNGHIEYMYFYAFCTNYYLILWYIKYLKAVKNRKN